MSRVLLPIGIAVALTFALGCPKDEAPTDDATEAAVEAVGEAVGETTPTPEPTPEPPPLKPVTEGDLDAAKALVQEGFTLIKAGDCVAVPGLMAEAMTAEECQTWAKRVSDQDVTLAEIVGATAATDPGDTIEVKVKLDSTKAKGQELTVRVARRGDGWKLLR